MKKTRQDGGKGGEREREVSTFTGSPHNSFSFPPFFFPRSSFHSRVVLQNRHAMHGAPRILLCGDVLGHLNHLFKRFHTVNKSSGPFDALLCVGQFFPETTDGLGELMECIEGRSPVPIPTYFTGDYGVGAAQVLSKALLVSSNQGFKMDGIQICDNLFCLKGSGKFTLHGLSIVYISGRHQLQLGSQVAGVYTEDDVGALRAMVEDSEVVDIFLSNEWPTGVWNRADTSSLAPGFSDPLGCDPLIAELVSEIKPRYHIAGTKGIYFAREPYANDKAVHTTRFLGLAAVGNKDKLKFMHAISPTPASTMSPSDISAKPPNTTISPYITEEGKSSSKDAVKRSVDTNSESQFWRFNVSQKRQKQGDGGPERLCFNFTSSGTCPRGNKCNFRHDDEARAQYSRNVCFDFLNKGKCERGPDCRFRHSLCGEGESLAEGRNSSSSGTNFRHRTGTKCWFCLSSPDVESHLLTSVGESYYCALAKGPLVPDHILLIPVEHCPNTLSLAPEIDDELKRLKIALKLYFKKHKKVAVFYEWVSQHTSHANLQAIPVPISRAADVRRAFVLAAKRLGFEFEIMMAGDDCSDDRKLLRSQFDQTSNFFYVELPDGNILRHSVEEQEKFPIQFGREVLAGTLNMADRADWRNCKLSKEEEIKMVEDFKKEFGEYDPFQ